MKKIIILSFFFFAQPVLAAIPTVEGLFRNGNNADVAGDTVALSFVLEKIEEPSAIDGTSNTSQPLYVKSIFSMTEGEPVRLLQIVYDEAAMSNNGVIDIYRSENLSRTVGQESHLERGLLYAILLKYGLNRSEGFNSLLKKISPDYRTNVELINPSKKELYQRQKNFYQSRAQSSDEGRESPMRPEDREKRDEVNKILKENFYQSSGQVKVVRNRGQFYWEVELEKVRALFSHEKHQLRSLNLQTIDGPMGVTVGEYIMFDGVHEIPKMITFSLPNGENYRLTFLAHQDFVSRGKTFAQRVQDYEKMKRTVEQPSENLSYMNMRRIFVF